MLPRFLARSAAAARIITHSTRIRAFSQLAGNSQRLQQRTYGGVTALLLAGGATLYASSVIATSCQGAAHSTSKTSSSASTPSASASSPTSSPRGVSDLDPLALDFHTLGACPCPPLPASAPRWLHNLAKDEEFQYRDLAAILDTSNHFIYDALSGEKKVMDVYYFCEIDSPNHEAQKAAVQAATAASSLSSAPTTSQSHAAHPHPHLAPALDFSPQPGQHLPNSAHKAFDKPHPAAPALTARGPEVRAIFNVGSAVCGHAGIVHGGLTAALMDEVSGAATFCAVGGGNFTANLNINYVKPLKAGQYIMVRAQAVKQERRKTWVNISVEDGRGTVFARGTALYVKPNMLPGAVLLSSTQ